MTEAFWYGFEPHEFVGIFTADVLAWYSEESLAVLPRHLYAVLTEQQQVKLSYAQKQALHKTQKLQTVPTDCKSLVPEFDWESLVPNVPNVDSAFPRCRRRRNLAQVLLDKIRHFHISLSFSFSFSIGEKG